MPNARLVVNKIVAVLLGLLSFALTFAINLVGSLMLDSHLRRGAAWLSAKSNYPLVVGYEYAGRIFFYGYPAAVGITAMVFLWHGRPKESFRIMLHVLVLMVVGPLTFINYLVSDQWLNLWVQLVFNLFTAFVGYVLVLKLRDVQAEAADMKALQSLAILLIASLLVALPLFYSAIFLAVALHLIDYHGVQAISEKIPLAVAGAAGIVAVLLNNLDSIREKKKREA
jgi:hypothetical protein